MRVLSMVQHTNPNNQQNRGGLEYPEFFLKARELYEFDDEKLEVLSPNDPPQEPKRNLLKNIILLQEGIHHLK